MKQRQIFSIALIGLCLFTCMGITFDITAEESNKEPDFVIEYRNGNLAQAEALFWKKVDFSQVGAYGHNEALDLMMYGFTFAMTWMDTLKAEQYDFAVTLCNKAIEKLPAKYGQFRSYIISLRAQAWEAQGQYDKAIEDYTTSDSSASLAWLLATCPDAQYRNGEKAVQRAKQVIAKAEKEEVSNFEVLAAAYAEAGNFQEAIKAQEKVLALLTANQEKALTEEKDEGKKAELKKGQENMKKPYQERLEWYKAGKPWRTEPPKKEGK